MSEGEASTDGSTVDPRTSGHAASAAEDGGPMAVSPARHGDNYADWLALEEGVDILMPGKSGVPCSAAVANLATIVDEQAEELENVRGLLRRVEESNTDLAFKLQFVLDRTPTEDGVYMFPDGDSWGASRELAS